MNDITFTTEEELDLNRVFHRCVENCNEAIMITDHEGRLKYVNKAWSRIYGYQRKEVIGQNPRILKSGIQDKSFYNRMWSAILDNNVGHWKGEVVNRAKDGTLVHVILTITPMKDANGQINGYMGIALDVSEQKKLEGILSHHDRLASLGLMVSGLAHEISNPIAIARGRAEMLLKKFGKDPEAKKGLGIVIKQADRVGDLLKKLNRFGRAGDVIQFSPIRIRAVIEDMMYLTLDLISGNDVKVAIEISHDVMVKADENYLQQIFINLFINAIHAIHDAIKSGRTKGHCITLRSSLVEFNGQSYHAVSINDTGCGISQAHIDKVFEFFFTTKAVGQGTGLGLAIAAKLTDEMGGFITVDSEPNEGTCFTVHLPACLDQENEN